MSPRALIAGPALALEGLECVCVAPAEALRHLRERPFELLIVTHAKADPGALELLRAAQALRPDVRRVLLASYDALPEIVGAQAWSVVTRVLPADATPARLSVLLHQLLSQADEPSSSRSTIAPGPPTGLEPLARATALRLAQVRGAIVRPLAPDPRTLQVQFVLRGNKRLEALRRDLTHLWGPPTKPRGAPCPRALRKHPVVLRSGGLSSRAELWTHRSPASSGPAVAYVALLPWSREPRLTAVLGLAVDVFDARFWTLLTDAHREALSALSEFALPDAPESARDEKLGLAAPEYDWIVAPGYVGLDRRQTPTSFLNRFIFFGRRRHTPTRLLRTSDSFTDRPSGRVLRWLAVAFACASVDTVLTYLCVRHGLVREANPLLRPLVLHHPAAYVAVKNGLTLLAFAIVARFHLFRI
ncbi:MAG: hypothetical protein JST92_21135, partial [Deltaproteobacteria bacterium]|nr:hypothetical protein [Deltaproteobacteria bacterium]